MAETSSTTKYPERRHFHLRDTNETRVLINLSLDGGALTPPSNSPVWDEAQTRSPHASQYTTSQTIDVDTGVGFLDHMLHALAKHAGWSVRIRTQGDLHSELSLSLSLYFSDAQTSTHPQFNAPHLQHFLCLETTGR